MYAIRSYYDPSVYYNILYQCQDLSVENKLYAFFNELAKRIGITNRIEVDVEDEQFRLVYATSYNFV